MNIEPDELNALLDGARTRVANVINDQVLAQRQNDEGVISRLNKRIAELEAAAHLTPDVKMLTDAMKLLKEGRQYHDHQPWRDAVHVLTKLYEESL